MEKNYCNLVNTCVDYDNNANDSLCLHYNLNENFCFINEELVDSYIEREVKENGVDVNRLRAIIGDTYYANIYKLSVYGNLENVEKEDLENAIEYCIDLLKEVI